MTTHRDTGDDGRGPSWSIRPITPQENTARIRVVHEALNGAADLEPLLERRGQAKEGDRHLGAFEGDQMVGAATAYSFTMTMPGGPRPVAGVSGVGVWPTHRRRGILSGLMRRQLADIRDNGENVAALWASEGAIYGRFGYGNAAEAVDYTLYRGEGVLRPDAPRDPALRVRLTEAGTARAQMAAVHRALVPHRTGEFERDERWWDAALREEARDRGGMSPLKCVLVEDGAGPLGYATYRVRAEWSRGLSEARLRVCELYATSPAAHTLLWEHVFSRDLISAYEVPRRPADDPLRLLIADPLRLRAQVYPGLWIRLVDVGGALSERTYAAPVDTVIEVTDASAPWNAGRWHLAADRDAARCVRTGAEPDLRLDVSHLGAAHLGGRGLGSYLAAGLITEYTPEAVERLDAALHRSDAPHCGLIF